MRGSGSDALNMKAKGWTYANDTITYLFLALTHYCGKQ